MLFRSRDYAGVDEGMAGISTRFAFKILSQVFNFDHTEVAANPALVHEPPCNHRRLVMAAGPSG